MDTIRHRTAQVLTKHIDDMKKIVDGMKREETGIQSENASNVVSVLEKAISEMEIIIHTLDSGESADTL